MKLFIPLIYFEEDTYVAKCPEVGTANQGKTVEEPVKNLTEATALFLEEFAFTVKVDKAKSQ